MNADAAEIFFNTNIYLFNTKMNNTGNNECNAT